MIVSMVLEEIQMLDRELSDAWKLEVWVSEEGVKFKVNGGTWSPPMGEVIDETTLSI